ncbi:hypothetical protein HSEST_0828 [Halapricum desulfuricans]|uniref:Uncharacterized protein n=1 Tax=Halapricum desulfuricans TaxID=2841257 RepID=A0A897NNN1_9EURY|nr:hypothetical protein HSEST_0828 [Halapricum desulfuricans]
MSESKFNSSVVPPEHDGASKTGEHRVIRKSEWVPGHHPEPHKRDGTRSGYIEHYLKCVRCGVEVLNKMDFPDECRG